MYKQILRLLSRWLASTDLPDISTANTGTQGRFANDDMDLVPDKHIIGIVGEGGFQEGLDMAKVVVVGEDRKIEP